MARRQARSVVVPWLLAACTLGAALAPVRAAAAVAAAAAGPAPGYYSIAEFSNGITPGSKPLAITTGADGNVWSTDGTTGRIVGGAVGALIGNSIDNGRSSILGTLIGAGAGAALGREVERGSVRCR